MTLTTKLPVDTILSEAKEHRLILSTEADYICDWKTIGYVDYFVTDDRITSLVVILCHNHGAMGTTMVAVVNCIESDQTAPSAFAR